METLIHADIFFFVSTLSLVFVTVGLIVALIYVIKILRNVSDVSSKVKEEGTEIIADIKGLRGSIKSQGFGLRAVKEVVKKIFSRRKK